MGADAELLGGTAIKPKGWDRQAYRYSLDGKAGTGKLILTDTL